MPSNYVQITQDNIRRRGEEFDDIGQLISEQLYSDRSHFIYELLQNAEDALERRFRDNPHGNLPCGVKFVLFEDKLEFRHFGQLFNEDDVRGVCDVLKGTKYKDITQIGKFGIGFKSVYAFTAMPEIYSGDEHFVIERYIRPKAKEPYQNVEDGETLFVFPFNHKVLSKTNAFDLILNKMKTLGPRVLLFLNRINEIEWNVESTGERGQYLKESKKRGAAKHITVLGQKNGQDEEENWLIFERPVPAPDGSDRVNVEVGFLLAINPKDQKERIAKISDSPLVVYFPTEKVTRFGFLIQGPYRTTPSRDNIPKDDDWNKTLVRETARLLPDALRRLKELRLLSVSLLETLPIRIDDFLKDSIFYPIVEAIHNALINEELLPADDGTFVSARNAKLARGADLRKLLNQDQLNLLFQSQEAIKWLAGEITQDRTPDLHAYLLKTLHVDEVTPESFARKITQQFLEKQSDDWFVFFYQYLSDKEALWRPPRWSEDTATGLLRTEPILRLQDDRLKAPFGSDGTIPNAFLPPPEETDFPIVKRTIANSGKVNDFLKRLGLSEPDVFDDIVRRVLPKYNRSDALTISQQEHATDIQKILRAMKSDSEAGKRKVVQAARQTSFLQAINQNGERVFKKPIDVYFPKQELKDYFFGCPDAWFLDETEGKEEWYELGMENKPRFQKVHIKLPWEEKNKLIGNQGHTRDIETIDYKLDGLTNVLSRFSEEGKTFERYSIILWNFLLQHLKASSHYRFYEGEYRWFYRQERFATFEASWKKQLRNTLWLPKNHDDVPHLPSTLRLLDLPEQFDRNEKLADLLGMQKDFVAILAEKVGVQAEDIELIRQNPEEFQKWKNTIVSRNEKPSFPERIVIDPNRRHEKIVEQINKAHKKVHEERERSVRTSRNAIDPSLWLREQYTNENCQMVCQICKKEMPFRKRNGEHYFEAVEALSENYFPKEHEAQFLALCPLCAAMYKEFVKLDQDVMKDLYNALKNSNQYEVPLKLGELETSITFVESHRHDLRTILEVMDGECE